MYSVWNYIVYIRFTMIVKQAIQYLQIFTIGSSVVIIYH